MTKQEAVREGTGNLSQMDSDGCSYNLCQWFKDDCRKCRSTAIVEYLHSQGVVIKVDRELPKYSSSAKVFLTEAYPIVQKELLEAGYTAVEPLIKE